MKGGDTQITPLTQKRLTVPKGAVQSHSAPQLVVYVAER